MSRIIKISSVLIAFALLSIAYSLYLIGGVPTMGQQVNSLVVRNLTGNEATTSPAYLIANAATTTYSFYTERATAVDLHVLGVASSSASELDLEVAYSNNNVDWYGEDDDLAFSSGVKTHNTNLYHHWDIGSEQAYNGTASSTRVFKFENVRAKYMRVGVAAKDAAMAVFINAVLQEPAR